MLKPVESMDMETTFDVRCLDALGRRVVIPAAVRTLLGWQDGSHAVVSVDGGGRVVLTRAENPGPVRPAPELETDR